MRNKKQIEKDKAITLIEKYIIELEAENVELRLIINEGIDDYWLSQNKGRVAAALKG